MRLEYRIASFTLLELVGVAGPLAKVEAIWKPEIEASQELHSLSWRQQKVGRSLPINRCPFTSILVSSDTRFSHRVHAWLGLGVGPLDLSSLVVPWCTSARCTWEGGEGFLKHSEMVGISEISAKQAPAEFEESPWRAEYGINTLAIDSHRL